MNTREDKEGLLPGAGKQKKQLALRMLIDKAGVQGYLTADDLIEFFPDASQDTEKLSLLLAALRRRDHFLRCVVEILGGDQVESALIV